ncbi:NADPH-dependent FMN reductase [Streptomyces tubercidicus]|uniref:NADPH-dependent FMN reductase n=1 Tax=Streptomyces tubercidicus TaxID=47759 RepID=UPI0032481EC3
MKLLALSGSLRARSSNGAVLRSALTFWDGPAATADIGALPHFNPDLDGEGATPPAPVAALRTAAASADALLVVSPEYAHGVPRRPQERPRLADQQRRMRRQTGRGDHRLAVPHRR